MPDSSETIKIFTGTEVTVSLLKAELEKSGIVAAVHSDFASGAASGFFGGPPSMIDLFVQQSDFKKAEPIVKAFIELNK